MAQLLTQYSKLKSFKDIISKEEGMIISDVTDNFISNLIASDFLKNKETIFLVLPNISQAQKFYDDISSLIDVEDVLFYPAEEPLTSMLSLSSESFKVERIYTLGVLLEETPKIVVMNQAAAIRKTLHKKDWKNAVIRLFKGFQIDPEDLSKKLVSDGYVREYTVMKMGEFSIRGSILDVFPIGAEYPFRIDFFDIEIDDIKIFDPVTQMSIGKASEFTILPINELFFNQKIRDVTIREIESEIESLTLNEIEKEHINNELDRLYQKQDLDQLEKYIGFFNKEENLIFDFSSNKKIFYLDLHKMEINEKRMFEDVDNYEDLGKKLYYGIPPYVDLSELKSYPHHEIRTMGKHLDTHEYSVGAREVVTYQGNDHTFINELKETKDNVVVSFTQENRHKKFISMLELNKINYLLNPDKLSKTSINIFYPMKILSFMLYKENYLFIDESDIYDFRPSKRKIRYKSVLSETVKISDINELKIGDFVVHYDYGIGEYKGIKTMELSGQKRDYIHIGYHGTDYLYIPVDQIEMVLKYASREGVVPRLTKLGTNQWSNTKKRVKKKLDDLSDRLLALYQEREQATGFVFHKDELMHQEFAEDFQYIETKDQQQAINDVRKDMESNKPMDRLICGDVGFGKTEVAMRAAFKAVYSGKQVAYLVPTTVLARQHYHAFKERFEPYGISVGLLSRFVTKRDQTILLEQISKGQVDIIIGTHRLLSKDVIFKDLGLLVVDEEQRFGVEHKERIKEMKVNVDALSLSATPIPRTLQMSLVGIKDLSMIETPPLNRYPIQTYIIERHDAIIKEAIEREIARGGQVFYLYNRVYDMDLITRKLERLVPEARIQYAHGKMNRDDLEQVISSFIEKEFDVLVSTTIIETGIDIPNTNTLIIHDADRLGLSQLYQIRGRVGRSDKIAYAYLMYDRKKILTEEAQNRLKTIKDFQELGSGFKIAMRDLSIRGAGDILGEEQSGFIDSVGLEVYLKLLEETINEKQGIETPEGPKDDQVILSERHIKQSYIENDDVRMAIHKRIAGINNVLEFKNLIIELEDRFGVVDESLKDYMYEKLLKKLSNGLGVVETIKTTMDLTLVLSEEASKKVDGERLFSAIHELDYMIKLAYLHNRVHITLVFDNNGENYMLQMIEYLSLLLN